MAYGGVIFIDEAYRLFSYEIDELVELMEDNRKDVIVILAGYTSDMKNFLHRNDGLRSRFKYLVEFEDYTEEEMWEILNYLAKRENLAIEPKAKDELLSIFSSAQCNKELGNGRLVRNIFDMAIGNQSKRLKDIDFKNNKLDLSDFQVLKKEDFTIDIKKITGNEPKKIVGNVDPEIELDSMIGLYKVKELVKKAIASNRINKLRNRYENINTKKLIYTPMHMAFLGNPGTSKTTVARLFARILKKKGLIKKDEIVEVGRKDLVGEYVGHTAPKVESIFEKAKGGVLFIDEAYSLVDDRAGSFGDEAINTIIAEMENHRDEVIVIFAGYTDKMRNFIARNEGLRSRLSYVIEFDDYNNEELIEIFDKMIRDIGYKISDDAKELVKQKISAATKNKDFGNGRYVRKLIENAKLNMDLRLNAYDEKDLTYKKLTTFDITDFRDIMDDNVLNDKKKNPIGFAV